MEDYFRLKMFFEYIFPLIFFGLLTLVILGCIALCKIEEIIDRYKRKRDKKKKDERKTKV